MKYFPIQFNEHNMIRNSRRLATRGQPRIVLVPVNQVAIANSRINMNGARIKAIEVATRPNRNRTRVANHVQVRGEALRGAPRMDTVPIIMDMVPIIKILIVPPLRIHRVPTQVEAKAHSMEGVTRINMRAKTTSGAAIAKAILLTKKAIMPTPPASHASKVPLHPTVVLLPATTKRLHRNRLLAVMNKGHKAVNPSLPVTLDRQSLEHVKRLETLASDASI
jgi:hypothetical protein